MSNGSGLKKLRRLFAWSAVVLLLGGCAVPAEDDDMVVVEGSDSSIAYQFVTAETGDVVLTEKVRCTYTQQNGEEVSFSLSGRLVDKVYVEEGDYVKKGDLLAELSAGNLERQIEDLEYRIARNELLLEYAAANENLDISQAWVNHIWNHMYDEEGIKDYVDSLQQGYEYQKEDCEDALELDRQDLARLKQELQYCRVYAGTDGMVYKLTDDLEDSTSRVGEVIMTIVDNSQCLFETEEPELAGCFKEGEPVSMTINVGNAAGEYELMPHNISEWGETQQFSIFDGPMTSGIEVGTGGTIQFVRDKRENVLCVPKLVLHAAEDRSYVFVTDEDDMRQIRWVETGLWGDETVEITGGLEAGEKVIR